MRVLLMIFILFMVSGIIHAEESNDSSPSDSILSDIKDQSSEFDPDEIGQHLEQKGHELLDIAQSGSILYIALALVIFLVLLIGGFFFSKLVKIAFGVLFVSLLGFIILNFWPEMVEVGKGIWDWFLSSDVNIAPGVEDHADTSGV